MLQLSIFEHITPQDNPTPLRFPNPRKAEKLKTLADKMQSQIEKKLNPAIGNQRITARRRRIARSIQEDGKKLQQIQSWLYKMAEAAEQGVLPNILSHITAKNQLELLWTFSSEQWNDKEIKSIFINKTGVDSDWLKRLHRAQIYNVKQVKKAISALKSLHQPATTDPIQKQIQDLEDSLIGMEFPGYFPTPNPICKQMVKLASLSDGMKVLEPSAGKGSLCQRIIEAASVELDVCEIEYTLREILGLKGFNLIGSDFLKLEPKAQYQRILMNPPFGQGAMEVRHIYQAYNFLAPSGRIVSIAPESINFRRDRIYKEFRQWLDDKCSLNQSLPDGAFLTSDRPTNVKTRILVMDK